MSHYGQAEWQAYKEDRLDLELKEDMETHLYQCDHCLNNYLNTIVAKDLEVARGQLPADFTVRVLTSLSNSEGAATKVASKPKAVAKSRLLVYYAAVASLMLLLTANGLFDSLGTRVPAHIGGISLLETRLENKVPGDWSLGLIDRTTGWLEGFIDNEEVTKE